VDPSERVAPRANELPDGNRVFGARVGLGGFSVTLLIVVLMLARAGVRRLPVA
jgi:hypothetical protein